MVSLLQTTHMAIGRTIAEVLKTADMIFLLEVFILMSQVPMNRAIDLRRISMLNE